MSLELVRLGSEAFAMELLPELERTFGVAFDGDLGHIRTAGNLFDEIIARQPAVATRAETEIGMAFYALRRALAPLWREENPTPLTQLADKELPLPKQLKKLLEEQTRWEMPRVPMSMIGVLLAVALGAGAVYEFASAQPLVGIALVFLCAGAAMFEPGEFSGDWATLGSLAREVTNLNFSTLADAGPGGDYSESWAVFAEKLAEHMRTGGAAAAADEIGRETLLRFS